MEALSELGWLVGIVPAVMLVRERHRARRRRRALNRALHELRRPLQALALGIGARRPPAGRAREVLLDQAIAALEELDGAVNGLPRRPRPRLVPCREIVAAAVERWGGGEGTSLRLYWDAGPAIVVGEPQLLSRVLDNLIANALEHGGPPIALTGSTVAGRLRITLSDGGRNGSSAGTEPAERNGDGRRGHGLRIVSEVVAAHGGRFALHRSPQGSVAALELPLAGAGRAAA